jgi:L-serine dehydratase
VTILATGVQQMMSVFEMFKIGIGPSSSHTLAPMKAGKEFVDYLAHHLLLSHVTKVTIELYGALSLTGKGHHTDVAVLLGLAGYQPETVDIDGIAHFMREIAQQQRLALSHNQHEIGFHLEDDLLFAKQFLPKHENALKLSAFSNEQLLYENTYYSIGGGFIVDEAHFGQPHIEHHEVPHPFHSAMQLLQQCQQNGLSLSGLIMRNELALHTQQEIEDYFAKIWQTMQDCINRGLNSEGILPGPLRVPRRAAALRRMLVSSEKLSLDPMNVIDWVNMYALAVNEENAAGGRVVTAPTNGACGIVPAVLSYYHQFIEAVTPALSLRYFLTCGAIGMLYKMNASISGAEVGCQGEVGVACSMAAAGLAELLGASPQQVCVAAEIGMEHNLGLTCDPVAGQVQVPCIERNAIAAVKAINAARMALRRTSEPRVSLDKVIETMYETGKDMNAKYRETSRGGLAIKVQCD